MRFFFSSRRRHTRCSRDWSSDVCSSDLGLFGPRTLDVIHTRPVSSNIGLCTFALLFQIGSVPQYGDGPATCCGDEGGMLERSEERRVGTDASARALATHVKETPGRTDSS